MQTFENDTQYAKITIKTYHVKVTPMFNHLLTLSEHLLNISPLACNKFSDVWDACPTRQLAKEFFIFQQDRALTHRDRHSVSAGFWSRQHHSLYHQFKEPGHQISGLYYMWNQWTEATSVKRLVYGMERSIIDSAINEWRISLQAYLRLRKKFWANAVTILITD